MEQPLISVVIPTYQRKPELIKNSINSVLQQSYNNIELLVIDDSPATYEFRNEVSSYFSSINDNRVKYIQHSNNLGANAARNTGIKNSNGQYLAFLDDDDEWEIDKLEYQIKAFKDEIGLVYCKGRIFDKNKVFLKEIQNELHKGFVFDLLMEKNFIGGNSFVLIKRSVLEDVGFFDENLLSNQDWELFLRIAKKYKISHVDRKLVNYYIYEDGNISSNPKKKLQGWNYMKNMYDFYLKRHRHIDNIWNQKISLYYLKDKQYGIALQILIKSFLFSPKSLSIFLKELYNIKKNRL